MTPINHTKVICVNNTNGHSEEEAMFSQTTSLVCKSQIGDTQQTKLQRGLLSSTFICAMLVLAVVSSQAMALKPVEDITLEKRLRPRVILSVDEVARQIRQQDQWRILAAEPTVSDEKVFYRFKLLNKKRGRVSVVVIDPNEPNLTTLDN